MSRAGGNGKEDTREWSPETLDRMLVIILSKISITNRKKESYERLGRIWLTVMLMGIIAAIPLEGTGRIAAIFIALYGLAMLIQSYLFAGRAGRIEEAMRGLFWRNEFGLPRSGDEKDMGITDYVGLLIERKKEFSTFDGAINLLRKNKDIERIIESYSEESDR